MKNASYRPNPIKRVYIPKETKGKMRPLGISCYKDKLVENAIAQLLEQIYEPKFYNESFGFCPNRNCHQAVREIIEIVQYWKTNYVELLQTEVMNLITVNKRGTIKKADYNVLESIFSLIYHRKTKCYNIIIDFRKV